MSEASIEAPTPEEMVEQVSSLRMISSLGAAGALAGLLIVAVYGATLPAIEAHKAEVLRRAVSEVLKRPARYETLYVIEQGLVETLPPGVSEKTTQRVYMGFDDSGIATGIAIKAAEPGFQDVVSLIYGFAPETGQLLGMKVLESKETPGLGDKIEKDMAFVGQFDGARPPLTAVKRATGAVGEVDAITGATISSRAVVRIINNSLEKLRPRIEARFEEALP